MTAEVTRLRMLDMLEHSFGPKITELLRDDTVEEVRVNPDGKLWAVQNGLRVDTGITLSVTERLTVINTVASASGEEAKATNPSFPAELPESGYRFHAVIPPQAPAPMFVVRRKPTKVFDLDDYVRKGEMSQAQCDVIREAIASKKNIVIVGGTNSGKTTLTNAVLRAIGQETGRIVTIEDTRELMVHCPEWIALRTCRKGAEISRSMAHLLRDALRLTPDRIIVGEVRGPEVVDMLDAWGTGHPGGLTTIHANSAHEALDRIEDLMRQGRFEPAPRAIARTINLIIYVGFRTVEEDGEMRSRRHIKSIVRVEGVKKTDMGHSYIFADACQAKET